MGFKKVESKRKPRGARNSEFLVRFAKYVMKSGPELHVYYSEPLCKALDIKEGDRSTLMFDDEEGLLAVHFGTDGESMIATHSKSPTCQGRSLRSVFRVDRKMREKILGVHNSRTLQREDLVDNDEFVVCFKSLMSDEAQRAIDRAIENTRTRPNRIISG